MSDISQDSPKSRLLLFCRSIGIGSNKEIERLFCLANGYFKSAGGGMNTDSIAKIISIYPNLNLTWLITGKGSMYFSAPEYLSVAEKSTQYQVMDYLLPVRMYNNPYDLCHPNNLLPPLWCMMPKSTFSEGDILVKITDEALYPTYSVGQYMLLSPSEKADKHLVLCALKNGDVVCGILEYVGGNADVVRISPLNPDKNSFPDMVISSTDISHIWVIKSVFSF